MEGTHARSEPTAILHYAVACGCTAYVIDTTERTTAEVKEVALQILRVIGANGSK
jgi:hypothetical protein